MSAIRPEITRLEAAPRDANGPLLFPEKMRAERWIAAGLFVISCAYLCAFRRYTSMDPDEGIILQGAERILHGEVLYRDFFSFFTPGSYYLLALILKIFGDSLVVARTPLVIYGGIFTVFAYWMARRVCARWSAMMAAYLAIVTCLPWRFMVLHNWDSTVMLCLAVYCAVLLMQAPHAGWAFGLGSFACLTFLFEQSKGSGLMLGLSIGFGVLVLLQPRAPWFRRASALAFAAGLAWPLALTLSYFASRHALGALFADWTWPLHHYSVVNQVPYGYSDWSDEARKTLFGSGNRFESLVALVTVSPCFVLPALPIIGLFLLAHWVIAARRGLLAPDRVAYYAIVGSSVCGALLSVIAVRANIIHFVYVTPLLYLVLAWIIDGCDISGGIVRSLQPVVAATVFVAFTAAGMALLLANRNAQSVVETRRGAVRAAGPDELLPYVQAHVPANEKIFVYPYFPLGYYLTATSNATRYEYLQPGMHTREQDEEAIREIEVSRTAVILFEPSFYEKISTSWPNTPVSAVAADPVADFILRNYHSCANLISGAKSRFSFMLRDGTPCPADAARAEFRN